MPDPIPPSDSPQPHPDDPRAKEPQPTSSPTPPPQKKKRWGRRITFSLLIFLLLIALLALLAPSIASTSPIRRLVLRKINHNLNGSVAIQDWSIGWRSGIDVTGIRVLDERNAEILSVAHLRTGLSLLDAMRGRFHCGETIIDEPNLEQLIIYPDGSNNLQKILKPANAPPPPSQPENKQPAKTITTSPKESPPPDITGHFTVNHLRGFIQDQRTPDPVIIAPESNLSLTINSLRDPIENAVLLVVRVGSNGAPGTLKLAGSAQPTPHGVIDEKLELTALPLAGINPFLALAGQNLALAGVANGAVVLKASANQQMTADGQILATHFSARGEPLHGETYATEKLNIPIKVTTVALDPHTTRIKIESLGVETDQGQLTVTGDLSPEALERVAANQPPGSDGKVTLSLHVPNLKPLADQLPKTLHLRDGVKVSGGQFFHETNIWLSKDKTVLESKTDLDGITGTSKGQPIALSPIHQSADLTVLPSATKLPDIHDLAITLVSGFASVHGSGKTLAALDLAGNIDLPKMRKELGQFVDFGKLDLGGAGDFAIRTSGDLTKTASSIKLDATAQFTNLKISGLDGAEPIEQPLVAFTASGNIQRDSTDAINGVDQLTMSLIVGEKVAPLLAATLQNGQLVLPAKEAGKSEPTNALDLLRAGDIAASINLPQAYDLSERLSKPSSPHITSGRGISDATGGLAATVLLLRSNAPADNPTTQTSLPPLKVLDGVANLKLSIAHNASSPQMLLKDGEITVVKLALERGASHYAPPENIVALQFAGELDAADRLRAVTLSKLEGSLVSGTIKMPKPIAVTGLNATPTAAGAIELAGKLENVTPLLETLEAKPHGQGYPYHGDYRLTQSTETKADLITLTGDAAVANLTVDDTARNQPAFTEKLLALTNQLSFDSKQKNLNISSLKIDMTSSDAFHVALAGSVLGIGTRQAFDNLKLTLGYDLEKLWPIVYPMLPLAQQKDLKDAKVAGKFTKVFTIAGSYPAGKPFNEAIRSVTANGSLAVDQFNAMGADIQKLDLPISLANGILRTQYTDRPEAQQLPPPAVCNGGQLTVAGAQCDLTRPDPRLTTPKDWKLLYNVSINPLLGDNLGKYINPVFANSRRAQGLIDVTIANCDAVALGAAMKTKDSGSAKITFTLRDMDIVNPLGSMIVGTLTKLIPANVAGLLSNVKGLNLGGAPSDADAFQGEIDNAVVTLDQGVTTQDVTLQLTDPAARAQPAAAQKKMPLHFQGNIQLADLRQQLHVTFPTELLAKYIPDKQIAKLLADLFPAGIPLTLTGTTTSSKIDAGEFVKQTADAFKKEKLNQIIGGGKGDKSDNPIGDLLDQFGKKKKQPGD